MKPKKTLSKQMTKQTVNLNTKTQEETLASPSEETILEKVQQEEAKQLKRLEKSYAQAGLIERIWLIFAPTMILVLIGYYSYIGILAFQHATELKLPLIPTETPVTEDLPLEEEKDSSTEELTETLEKQTYHGYANYNTLNVRSEPSETSTILGTLSLNETVEIIELATETMNWHKIKYQDQEAYVREDFIVVPDLNEPSKQEETTN